MTLNLLLGLVFAGIIQGIVLAGFIFFRKGKKTKATIYLGLLILSFTLSNLQYTLEDIGVISWDLFNLIYLPYLFLVAPFLFSFTTHLLSPDRKSKPIEKLLYVPFLATLLITLVYKFKAQTYNRTVNNDSFQSGLADIIDYYGDFINIPLIMTAILVLLVRIRTYEKGTSSFNTAIVKEELLWLKILLYVLLFSLIPWFVYTYYYFYDDSMDYFPAFVIASVVIYLIGYIGIHKVHILEQRKEIRSYSNSHQGFSIVEKTENTHILSLEKIVIGERKFLDPTISLDVLANELSLSKSHLSRIINSEMQTSFSDYINTLRVEEAKRHLLNPEFAQYTLVAIGLESGFNSKTTFNTTFKKHTGLTPSQFKKKAMN